MFLTDGTVGNERSLSNGQYYPVTQYGSLTNHGAIIGSTAGVYANGGVLTDDGFIAGGRYAIEANQNFTLNLANTAILDGKVLVRSGTGLLNLSGNAGTLAGIGTNFRGFATIALSPALAEALEGDTLSFADGEQINGFNTGDVIVLDGFAAVSQSIGIGGLVLSDGTSARRSTSITFPSYRNFRSLRAAAIPASNSCRSRARSAPLPASYPQPCNSASKASLQTFRRQFRLRDGNPIQSFFHQCADQFRNH